MNRLKQHKNSSKKRNNENLLKIGLSLFMAGIYFSVLFFIAPAAFAAAAPNEANNIDNPDVPSISSIIPEDYRYDSTGKADPFLSYLVRGEGLIRDLEDQRRREVDALTLLRSLQEVKTELQKFDITQLTLSSIITGSNGTWAMVVDPTGLGHVIKKDSLIGKNGGVVDEIIRKIERSEYGSKYIRKVIIKEPYISREGKIEYRSIEKDLVNPYYD